MKTHKSILLFVILFGAMFLFGFIENIKGVTFPLIKTDFDASYEQQGIMVSLLSVSYVIFGFLGGILLGRFGVKKTFIAGFIFMILGLGAAFFMPGFWSVAGALLVIFAGFGFFEVSSNALATQIFTYRAALLMNLLHFFYGAGSSFSPRTSGAISAALSWRHVYLLSIPLVLIILISSIFARFPGSSSVSASSPGSSPQADLPKKEKERPAAERVSFFTALKTPMVWIFSLVLGLMVAVELCSANWAGLYFQDVYNLDPRTSGAAFVSNFYILFTISRLLSGFAIEKIGYMRSLYIATVATVFVFVLGFGLGARGIYVLPALGFFTAIFWPTVLATAMGYFREDSPVMTSAIIVIAGAINGLIQFLIGFINRVVGPAWGYRSCLVYAVLIIAALVLLTKRMRRSYPANTGRGRAAGGRS